MRLNFFLLQTTLSLTRGERAYVSRVAVQREPCDGGGPESGQAAVPALRQDPLHSERLHEEADGGGVRLRGALRDHGEAVGEGVFLERDWHGESFLRAAAAVRRANGTGSLTRRRGGAEKTRR